MAGKADFTEQEWETLQKGVTGSALLVSLADRGFFDSFKEAGAVGKHLSEARKKSASPLIQELAQMRGTGFGLRTSPEEVERETTEALNAATSTLLPELRPRGRPVRRRGGEGRRRRRDRRHRQDPSVTADGLSPSPATVPATRTGSARRQRLPYAFVTW